MDERENFRDKGEIMKLENNFVIYFQKRCEELNIPVPEFKCYANAERQILSSISNKSNHTIEINVQYDARVENPLKFECKGYKLPMLMLDTIFFTIKKFRTVTALSMPNCHIRTDEIAKIATSIIETGCINDVNLDMNPNSYGNHYLLCSRACNLQYLSLKFCNLGDSGVKKIANQLKYHDNQCLLPTLVTLNLAHNQITDVGAIYIAKQMLHTNRSIQSINLSGNWITDTGALSILTELYMFPLTHEEIVELRKRKYVRLMQQEEKLEVQHGALTQDTLESEQKKMIMDSETKEMENLSGEKNQGLGMLGNNSRGLELVERAEEILSGVLDCHPFSNECYPVEGAMMSTGNLELQNLNLSYNHLTVKTLRQMIKCIYYHNYLMLNDCTRGLLRVDLKGNDIAEDDELWTQLYELLNDRQDNKNNAEEKYELFVPVESKILRSEITLKSINK